MGIVSLWREFEETTVASRNLRSATLGVYREIPNTVIHPKGMISSKRMCVGSTVHRSLEIVSGTENPIEKALLKKKTFVVRIK